MAKDNGSVNNNGQTNTIVGPNTVMHGNLDVKGAALIYGTVLGDVTAVGIVRTAQESFIKGAVVAKEAVIDGELEGSLTVSGRATLGGTAKILGEIRVNMLVIEEGAQFTGKCKMKGTKITRNVDLPDSNGSSDSHEDHSSSQHKAKSN